MALHNKDELTKNVTKRMKLIMEFYKREHLNWQTFIYLNKSNLIITYKISIVNMLMFITKHDWRSIQHKLRKCHTRFYKCIRKTEVLINIFFSPITLVTGHIWIVLAWNMESWSISNLYYTISISDMPLQPRSLSIF